MNVAVILPAAGLGTRMGRGSAEKTGTSRKQFMLLEGSPILLHTVRKFAASERVREIVVAVHDAVRPFIDLETIHHALDEAAETGAAIVGVVPVDTVKQVSRATGRARIRATLQRDRLVLAQTPQVFRYDLLLRAFEAARQDGFTGTDEASLVERLDVEVSVVLGSDRNIKITKPGDMDLARLFFQEQARPARADAVEEART